MTQSFGQLHMSKRKQIGFEQAAYNDVTIYRVPFTCKEKNKSLLTHDEGRRLLKNKLYGALSKWVGDGRGPIPGSSYGSCSVGIKDVNWEEQYIDFYISIGIGE